MYTTEENKKNKKARADERAQKREKEAMDNVWIIKNQNDCLKTEAHFPVITSVAIPVFAPLQLLLHVKNLNTVKTVNYAVQCINALISHQWCQITTVYLQFSLLRMWTMTYTHLSMWINKEKCSNWKDGNLRKNMGLQTQKHFAKAFTATKD